MRFSTGFSTEYALGLSERQHRPPPRHGAALFLLLFVFAGVFASCKGEPLRVREQTYPDLTRVRTVRPADTGNTDGLLLAATRHMETVQRRLDSGTLSEGERRALNGFYDSAEHLRNAAREGRLEGTLRQDFDFYRSGDPDSVLVTGYFTPLLNGSDTADDRYRFPVYGPPEDLITVRLSDFSRNGGLIRGRVEDRRLVPYHTREAIESGKLESEEPILYVDDQLALFFLQVQGSGVVILPDGSRIRLNYAGGNGHPYQSIGRVLIERGAIPRAEMSMEAIGDYFRGHPDEMDEILNRNPSYVFFQTATDGPFGSTGTVVTAGRTIAADASVLPELGIAYLETMIPVGRNTDGSVRLEPMKTLVFHQDAGGAINGPDHVDLYFGEGNRAGYMAGHMKSKGTLYYLMPKGSK